MCLHDGQIPTLQRQKVNWSVYPKDVLLMAFTKEEVRDEKGTYPLGVTVIDDSQLF